MKAPAPSAAEYVPAEADLAQLKKASQACRGCSLWEHATQTIFGEGPPTARVVLLGEQPGDVEDRQGLPFVGPAGRLLDSCLERAGIDRKRVYLTNAVKHFKWEPQGERRLHKTPTYREVTACKPWLVAELANVTPHVIVCLGATATHALLGQKALVRDLRGVFTPYADGIEILVTVHPSSLLRAPDPQTRQIETDRFVSELALVAERLHA